MFKRGWLFILFVPFVASAQASRGALEGLGFIGPASLSFSYEGRYLPGYEGVGQTENRLAVVVPVYKNEKNSIALSGGAAHVHLDETVRLDSGQNVPTDLYRMEIGAQYAKQLKERRSCSLRTSVGYSGDRPGAGKDTAFSFVGTYGYPSAGGKGYWVWMAFWANNSVLANYVPIPGIVYIYRGETVRGIFGFPVTSFQWTPEESWVFSFSLFGPVLQTEAAYGRSESGQGFLGYAYSEQSFIPSQRPDRRDRLILHEQKVDVGFRINISKEFLGEVRVGESFDRSIEIGRSVLKRDGGTANLKSDPYVNWSLKAVF